MTKQKSEGYVSPVGELARQQVMVETIRLEQQKDQLKMESVKKSQLVDFFPSGKTLTVLASIQTMLIHVMSFQKFCMAQ